MVVQGYSVAILIAARITELMLVGGGARCKHLLSRYLTIGVNAVTRIIMRVTVKTAKNGSLMKKILWLVSRLCVMSSSFNNNALADAA